ncbi:MAG: serine/threonine-protein kinase, partial [Planctomycetota bacterium]
MPTREDVDLARAAIDRGLLTVPESVDCLKAQKTHTDQGREVPLERIFLQKGLLNERQIKALKDSLARMDALRHVGHYKILGKLGTGGMGTVYKAQDTKSGRDVALKVLSPGHARNREYIQRFLREARASGRLSHSNIVQGYDAGEADGQYYFAMEFVDGTTVGEMLRQGKPIPEQQALDIAIQIAKALQHAEENDLVHRDIKPDNIMITEDGTAKLADLGLARLATSEQREKRELGTVYYASPEQCEGDEEVDTKSDMYAFGGTLFHMLIGRVPFDGESPEDIMAKHVQERPPYLKDLNVQLSHGVSKIVRKLMAKYKRDRYPSMEDVVTDLILVRMGRSPKLGKRPRHDSGEYRYRSSTGSWRTKTPSRWQKVRQIALCVGVGLFILGGAVGVFVLVKTRSDSSGGPAENKEST